SPKRLTVGDEVIADIGPLAHGGHCIAHIADRTVFVRHAIPGELARVRITETTSRIDRGEVIEVLTAAPSRVSTPCKYAGECGGCDFQHIDFEAQLELLSGVVS